MSLIINYDIKIDGHIEQSELKNIYYDRKKISTLFLYKYETLYNMSYIESER